MTPIWKGPLGKYVSLFSTSCLVGCHIVVLVSSLTQKFKQHQTFIIASYQFLEVGRNTVIIRLCLLTVYNDMLNMIIIY